MEGIQRGIRTPRREHLRLRPAQPSWATLVARIERSCAEAADHAVVDTETLRRLLPGLDARHRATVAERLADKPCLPRDIAVALAGDPIAVAHPVLARSPVLTDEDLIELVQDCSREHHLAIAGRPRVSPAVSEILVEMSDRDVMVKLLENPGAELYDDTLSRLVSASRHYEKLQVPLLGRPELSREWAHAMSGWAGDAVRRRIAMRFGTEALAPPEGVAAAAGRCGPDPNPNVQRIGDMPARCCREHVHAVVAAVRCGDMRRLEQAFAALTGLPAFAVARILYNANPEPLAVVCRALDFKRPLFAAIYGRLHCTDGSGGIDPMRRLRTAIGCFNRLQAPQASGILETWRRAPITVWQNPGWKGGAAWAYPAEA